MGTVNHHGSALSLLELIPLRSSSCEELFSHLPDRNTSTSAEYYNQDQDPRPGSGTRIRDQDQDYVPYSTVVILKASPTLWWTRTCYKLKPININAHDYWHIFPQSIYIRHMITQMYITFSIEHKVEDYFHIKWSRFQCVKIFLYQRNFYFWLGIICIRKWTRNIPHLWPQFKRPICSHPDNENEKTFDECIRKYVYLCVQVCVLREWWCCICLLTVLRTKTT